MTVLVYGQNSPGQYTVKNAKINTQSSDFGTAFFGKDKVVFASPKQGFTLNREENTSQPFLDLYIGEVTEDGQIIRKKKLEGDINSKYHEGMVSFTKDMKTVYFSANNYVKKKKNKEKNKSTKYLQLFKASVTEDGEWTNLILLPFNGENFSSGHPVLNKDDSELYFVSDRPESIGRTDLFVVDVYKDGSYSEPRNLGPKINTSEREMFPFIGTDNVLYFSSDGYPGYGELDVYASKIFDSTVSEPINLEEPVNSEYDDFAYIINDDKGRGYFSSNREGGHGDDDIYSFIASPPIYIECFQEIKGVVRDLSTQELVPDVSIILFDEKGKELESFMSSKTKAEFSFQQYCNTTYTIKGYIEGHLVGELDITTVNDLDSEPYEIVFNLTLDNNNQDDTIAETSLMVSEDEATFVSEKEKSTSSSIDSDLIHVEEQSASIDSQTNAVASSIGNNNSPANVAAASGISGAAMSRQQDTNANRVVETDETVVADKAIENAALESGQALAMESEQTAEVNTAPVLAAVTPEHEQHKDAKVSSETDETVVADKAIENAELESGQALAMESEQTAEVNTASAMTDANKNDVDQSEVAVNTKRTQETHTATPAASLEGDPQDAIAMNGSKVEKNHLEAARGVQTKKTTNDLIQINTIYFDYDKYDIRFDAKIELEKIAVVLKENPDTKIKVNAHTDIRGKKPYNLKLSKSRAYSTVQYLVDKGIEVERISSEGHGETQVAEKCTKGKPCTGLQHQLNRRSEFLIVDKFSDAVVAQSINKMAAGNYAANGKASNSGLYLNYDFSDNREVYTVQIGAFKGKVQTDKYSKLTDLFNYRYNDGLNRYYAGIFETPSEARSYMNKMRKQGFKDAFVVGLKGTDRF